MILNQKRFNILNAKFFYLFGFALLLASLPFSKFTLSISEFILLFTWIGEGRIVDKLRKFWQNKIAVVLISLYLLHLLGLLYTTDFKYAFSDLQIKIVILIFPIILSSIDPIEEKWFNRLLYLFVTGVFFSTIISLFVFLGYSKHVITDIRQISIYTSHIRLSLMICLSIFILIYFIINKFKTFKLLKVFIHLALIVWLVSFLALIESATGFVIIVIIGLSMIFYSAWKTKIFIYRILLISILVIITIFIGFYIHNTIDDFFVPKNSIVNTPLNTTKLGNPYLNNLKSNQIENGYYIWRNYSIAELKESWNKRSKISIDSLDKKKQPIFYTMMRYLTSRGLTKDAQGISNLTDNDIQNIENGIANIEYTKSFSIKSRAFKIFSEYENYNETKDASGYSIIMRLEFWKTAIDIIKKKPIIGVGTGDINIAFKNQYKINNTKLSTRWQLKSHNQFIAITVAFGIIGLICFFFILLYPILKIKKIDYLYIVFFLIVFISFFAEDTLETQVGVTLYAFFNSFILFIKPQFARVL